MEFKQRLLNQIIKGYVFIHIPKNGGTSVIGNKYHFVHVKTKTWYEYHGYSNFIALVRNPYTRWESIWAHCRKQRLRRKNYIQEVRYTRVKRKCRYL